MDDSGRTGSFELTLKKKSYELTESEAASSTVGMYVSAQKLQHKMDVQKMTLLFFLPESSVSGCTTYMSCLATGLSGFISQ